MKHSILKAALLLLLPLALLSQSNFKKITLEDIYKTRLFSQRGFMQITPMNDGLSFCAQQGDSIHVFDYRTGNRIKTLFHAGMLPNPLEGKASIDEFLLSPDESMILIATETEAIYRHSSMSTFLLYKLSDKSFTQVSFQGKQRLATFSPDGKYLAYIIDNNMYIKDIAANTEQRITRDGKENAIIYGTTDWVYEEEFSFTQAYFWSPDSKAIAYYRFDESQVKEFSFSLYGDLYPVEYRYKYPKAGEDNSLVSIHVYHLANQKSVNMDLGPDNDIYIPRIYWTTDPSMLCIQRLNRHQNHREILLADAKTGISRVMFDEKNNYYVDINDDLQFLKDGRHLILTSEKDGYNHIYKISLTSGMAQPLTQGNWDVLEVTGVDHKRGWIYYLSTEDSPLERNLYRVDLNGGKKTRISQRLGSNRVQFSANFEYYVNTFNDVKTPNLITVNDAKGKEIRVLQDNALLKERAREYGFTTPEFFRFTAEEIVLPDGQSTHLNGYLIKPIDFDPAKKYPVLMYVYGGPGSQLVLNAWGGSNRAWFHYLTQQGYIIACVDNRGTGGRGEQFKKCTYLQLGKYETQDQIAAARYLGSLPYVDAGRIGIFGWSYGGYMSALCMTKGADYFKAGISVAPVTTWRYYDNIYTERFMRKPQENPDGYDQNSPINHVDKLKGKLLLVHGMADDNVHMQNAVDLVSALVSANKDFDMFFYPNSNHGIYTGRNTVLHLYTRMSEFILENL